MHYTERVECLLERVLVTEKKCFLERRDLIWDQVGCLLKGMFIRGRGVQRPVLIRDREVFITAVS